MKEKERKELVEKMFSALTPEQLRSLVASELRPTIRNALSDMCVGWQLKSKIEDKVQDMLTEEIDRLLKAEPFNTKIEAVAKKLIEEQLKELLKFEYKEAGVTPPKKIARRRPR